MALFKRGKKSFTFSESALYLTAEINERGSSEEGNANMHLCPPALSWEPLFTLILGGFGRCACECMCVFGRVFITHRSLPSTTLSSSAIKGKEK